MKKILLVDDDDSIRLVYEEEFKEEGYMVICAENGAEALARYQSEKPDLVILDIQMPGMNGIEVLRQMKTIDPSIPIVLSSAYPEFKQDLGAWASDDYVVKSPDLSNLLDVVRSHLD